jgi:hypothetical protein
VNGLVCAAFVLLGALFFGLWLAGSPEVEEVERDE